MRLNQALLLTALTMSTIAGTTLALPAPAFADAQPAVAAPADLKAALPWDPALVRGTLPNGVSYIIRKHANPEARASVWLHIGSGSLNEVDETRGLAHFLEHMAFNGSENFPPGTVVNFFQSMGLQFGRDQNAFTSFDQTTYQLALPDTKPETIAKGLLFLSDVGGRLLLRDDEIDSERGIILEERRTRLGASQRIMEQVLPRLAPESTIGRRLPIGTEPTIKGVPRQAFVDYYTTFYVAGNMTVIAVADADPAEVVKEIEKAFGSLPAKPKPADLPVGVKGTQGRSAIVASDPDLKSVSLNFQRMEPPLPPSTTVGQMRTDLVDLIGTWAFNRRVAAMQAKGEISAAERLTASVGNFANAARDVSIEASGKPEAWQDILKETGREVQRARLHGFSEREIADARTALVSQAEEAASREATIPAQAHLRRINGDLASGEPTMSAAQRVDLLKQLLPTITASEVGQRWNANFDMDNVIFVAEVPSTLPGGVPAESDLVKAAGAALDVKPEAPKEEARAASLLSKEPAPGKVAESAVFEPAQVTSAWLSNGVRVHHRFMDVRKNEAQIVITIAGGSLLETAASRGLTEAGTLAWSSPATSALSSTQIRDLMTGKKVRVRGGAGGLDTLSIAISGDPAELEAGFQLAYLMLTDPVIEKAEFDRWKAQQARAIEQRKVNPMGVMMEALADGLYPKDELRTRPLTQEQVSAVTLEAAQAWLRERVKTGPIEVAIVGDVKAEQVMPLVEKYVGSLPARERIGAGAFASSRKVARNAGPITISRTAATQTDQAMVLDGFYGADVTNVRDVRLLQVASRVLSTRMVKAIREDKQLVYSIGAVHRPARELPGFGMFLSQAPTQPGKAEALSKALEEVYTEFAKNGPTEEEMVTAKKQFANLFAEQMKEPDFWLGRMTDLDYRGLKLEDTMEAPAFYQNVKGEDVREAFARYYKPENVIRFVVLPQASPDSSTSTPDAPGVPGGSKKPGEPGAPGEPDGGKPPMKPEKPNTGAPK